MHVHVSNYALDGQKLYKKKKKEAKNSHGDIEPEKKGRREGRKKNLRLARGG